MVTVRLGYPPGFSKFCATTAVLTPKPNTTAPTRAAINLVFDFHTFVPPSLSYNLGDQIAQASVSDPYCINRS